METARPFETFESISQITQRHFPEDIAWHSREQLGVLKDVDTKLCVSYVVRNSLPPDRHALCLNFYINLLKPTGHVMHQQFNIQQLYVLPTLYLFVLYLSENKQRLVPLTA